MNDELGYEDRNASADPRGRSALRSVSPRKSADPGLPDLRRQEGPDAARRALGYQCNRCADPEESGF